MTNNKTANELKQIYKSLSAIIRSYRECGNCRHGQPGQGDKNLADAAAVDAMRSSLNNIPGISVNVKIGEGERDDAPMLFIGERIGDGDVQIDIAWTAGKHQRDSQP